MARNEQQLQEFRNQLQRFRKYDGERLIKRQEWGVITLEDARADFERIYSIVEHLSVLPVDPLPADAITPISNSIKGINDLFENIDKFSVETAGNPSQQKTGFIGNVRPCPETGGSRWRLRVA